MALGEGNDVDVAIVVQTVSIGKGEQGAADYCLQYLVCFSRFAHELRRGAGLSSVSRCLPLLKPRGRKIKMTRLREWGASVKYQVRGWTAAEFCWLVGTTRLS